MTSAYDIPARRCRIEFTVKRSRFIATLDHAPALARARALAGEVRGAFAGANHHSWACVAGAPGDTARIGMSDDGEPHGTAGRPMLNVLLHSNVGEIAAVVTRYFGGIKLGTGGLVRAYSDAVKTGLEALAVEKKQVLVHLRLQVDYAHFDALSRLCRTFDARLAKTDYAASVTVTVALAEARRLPFEAALAQVPTVLALPS